MNMNNENGRSNNGARQIPAWWLELPAAEKTVIREVIKSIRGLKSNRSGEAAMAARKWERSIGCFIKFRLIGKAARGHRFTPRRQGAEKPSGPACLDKKPAAGGLVNASSVKV